MRVCGVICEYNPFHRGHMLHLSQARARSGADYIVCVMSGPFTQRGLPARHDKWLRARMALMGGADLVLELPARFSCAAAPDFAAGGVGLLAALGVATHLSFGCEPEAIGALDAAALPETPAFAEALRDHLAEGLPFPRARALAAEETSGFPELARLSALPNAALAMEYLRALPESIAAVPVPRLGEGYHSEALAPLASASAVRLALAGGRMEEALLAVPFGEILRGAEENGEIHEEEALTQALLYRLRMSGREALSAIDGMDEGVEARFLAAAQTATTRAALLDAVKTKRYTHARISRLATLSLLGVTRAFAAAHERPTYARVLGFRRSAAPLLAAIKRNASVPLVTRPAKCADPLLALDVRAQDVWALGCANPEARRAGRDYLTQPVILDD